MLPLYRDILADMETPVSAYCKTAQRPYSFLLESVSGGERVARYSFIGIDPYMVMTHRNETATLRRMHGDTSTSEDVPCRDPLAFIESELEQFQLVDYRGAARDELPQFHGGAVGYLSYDSVARFERLSRAREKRTWFTLSGLLLHRNGARLRSRQASCPHRHTSTP